MSLIGPSLISFVFMAQDLPAPFPCTCGMPCQIGVVRRPAHVLVATAGALKMIALAIFTPQIFAHYKSSSVIISGYANSSFIGFFFFLFLCFYKRKT